MKCLSTNTVSGNPCRRTVAAHGCPYHGNSHIQERLRLAVTPFVAQPEQPELFPRLTRDQIKALIQAGYDEEARTKRSAPCGCQG